MFAFAAAYGVIAYHSVPDGEFADRRTDFSNRTRPLVSYSYGIGYLPVFDETARSRINLQIRAANTVVSDLAQNFVVLDFGNG